MKMFAATLMTMALSTLALISVASAEDIHETTQVIDGAAGTSLVKALRAAGTTQGSSYDDDGAWKGLRVDQLECHSPGGEQRYSVCWFIDQRGYPDRHKSNHSAQAVALMNALYQVPLVRDRFPDYEDLEVVTIDCGKWLPALDFTCSVVVK